MITLFFQLVDNDGGRAQKGPGGREPVSKVERRDPELRLVRDAHLLAQHESSKKGGIAALLKKVTKINTFFKVPH